MFDSTASDHQSGSGGWRIEVDHLLALAGEGERQLDSVKGSAKAPAPRHVAVRGTKTRMNFDARLLAKRNRLRHPEAADDG